jgi:hypothetical protein
MIISTITLHYLNGAEIVIAVDHIGVRRKADPLIGDNPRAVTVLEIDGVPHQVKETAAEIAALIEALPS